MGLFDVFTGRSAKRAAAANIARAEQTRQQNDATLTGALDRGTDYLQSGISGYQPLYDAGLGSLAGYNMQANALGLNGAAGNAAAQGAFQAGPGYQWQVDQATDAAMRRSNALGSLGGNTATALTALGSNLANQEYQNWLANLSGYNQQGLTALTAGAGGQMAGYSGLSGLEQGIAGAKVGSNTNATALANQGQSAYGAAGQAGAANALNFGMNLANLFTKGFSGRTMTPAGWW